MLNHNSLTDGEIRLIQVKAAAGDPARNWLPAFHYAICDLSGRQMGSCDLRIGHNTQTYYGGNIGYTINEEFRGHHYAAKACRLLLPVAKLQGMDHLFITCDPENIPSRKTCEAAGGILTETVPLPDDNPMRLRGATHRCIYRFDLT